MLKLLDRRYRNLIKIIFFLLSPIIIFMIFIIFPIKKIRIGSIPTHRIGHLSQEMALYLGSKKKDNFDIFFPQNRICNLTLYNLIKKKLFVLSGDILWPIFTILKRLSLYVYFFDNFIVKTTVWDKKNKYNILKDFKLSKHQIKKGESFLKKIGIKKKDKIVLLCIRDAKYLKKNFSQNYSYHDHRNCNSQNFIFAINFLIKKGYYVFKMGQDSEDNLDLKSKKFINYSKYYRDDFMDIYLSYRCLFNISTSTGIDGVSSYIFKRPLLVANIVPLKDISEYATTKNFLITFKEYLDTKSNKKLNFSEMKKRKLFDIVRSSDFKKAGVKLIENDKITIQQAVKEMVSFLNNGKRANSNNFWKKYDEIFKTEKQGLYKRGISHIAESFLKKRPYILK